MRKYSAYLLYYIGDFCYWLYGKSMSASSIIQGNNDNGPWDIHEQEYQFEIKPDVHERTENETPT